jgi:hypothetical protein
LDEFPALMLFAAQLRRKLLLLASPISFQLLKLAALYLLW